MNPITVIEEPHKPTRIKFPSRKVIVRSLNDLSKADLVEIIPNLRENKGYKHLLVVMNCFPMFDWAALLINTTGAEVSIAMETIFRKEITKNVQTDAGLEFVNKHFH